MSSKAFSGNWSLCSRELGRWWPHSQPAWGGWGEGGGRNTGLVHNPLGVSLYLHLSCELPQAPFPPTVNQSMSAHVLKALIFLPRHENAIKTQSIIKGNTHLVVSWNGIKARKIKAGNDNINLSYCKHDWTLVIGILLRIPQSGKGPKSHLVQRLGFHWPDRCPGTETVSLLKADQAWELLISPRAAVFKAVAPALRSRSRWKGNFLRPCLLPERYRLVITDMRMKSALQGR